MTAKPNLSYLIETKGVFNVTGSHVRNKSGNISELVQDRDVVATDQITDKKYIAYRIAAIPMTLSDLQGRARNAGLLKCDFSYSCAPTDKISTDLRRRAVPLR